MTSGKRRRPLRVALVLHLSPRKLGSMEDWLLGLALQLRHRGHSVTVFCREPIHPEVDRRFRAAGVEQASIDGLGNPLRGVLRLRRFDVLHLNFVSPVGRMALIGFLAWPARVLVVDHVSREPPHGEPQRSGRMVIPLKRAKRTILSAIARFRLAGVAAVSDYVQADVRETLGLPETRLRTIYNGVDPERFHARRDRQVERDRFTIVSVANLIPEKGIDYLLRSIALADDPRIELTVVGDGPERSRLEDLASDLGIIERIDFVGLRDDVDQLLGDADLFVHPAVWGEAFGLTIAEAMASGCPVIASDVGGIPEVVENGVSGLLVPPADHEALSDAIGRLARDGELRRCLAEHARKRVLDHFDLATCVRAHVDWCEEAT